MKRIDDLFGYAAVSMYYDLLPGLGWTRRHWRPEVLPEYVSICGLCEGTGKWDYSCCDSCAGVGLRHRYTDIPPLSVIAQILLVQRACDSMEAALS